MKPSHTIFGLASVLLTIGAFTSEPMCIGLGFVWLIIASFMADNKI